MTVAQIQPPVQLHELDILLQTLFCQTAEELAKETGLIRRVRKLTGAAYAQALVFGWLAQPDASYSQLQATLALAGCSMSAQALEQRLGQSQSADFLQSLLFALLGHCVCSPDVPTALFERFEGVYLQDGTIISLPEELAGLYRGFGGNTQNSGLSALRVQVRLTLSNGALQGPWLQEAVHVEREGAGSLQAVPLPANALYVVDSHYPTLRVMKEMTQAQQWFLTHMKADMLIFDEQGVRHSLPEFLAQRAQQTLIDEEVSLGATPALRHRVRLLAFRVSQERAKERREQVNASTKRRRKGCRGELRVGKQRKAARPAVSHRHRPGHKRIQVADWTILLTNVPAQRLRAQEARALMRARWQIELLWRLWKERGQVDIWRSEKPMRVLCEIYAKLIGLVVQHWLTLLSCWQEPRRSLVKAAMVVENLAISYLLTLSGPKSSLQVLQAAQGAMKGCRLDSSRQHPSTASYLHDPDSSCLT